MQVEENAAAHPAQLSRRRAITAIAMTLGGMACKDNDRKDAIWRRDLAFGRGDSPGVCFQG